MLRPRACAVNVARSLECLPRNIRAAQTRCVIPSASEGPRLWPLITQARSATRARVGGSLGPSRTGVVFASRDDKGENSAKTGAHGRQAFLPMRPADILSAVLFAFRSTVQLRWAHRLKVYVPISENSAQ